MQAPRSWTERAYLELIDYHRPKRAATSRPGSSRLLFAQELSAAFKSVS